MVEYGTGYVVILDEGTDVWRPVRAEQIGPGPFRLLGSVPANERWQLQPGEVVHCESRPAEKGGEMMDFLTGRRGFLAAACSLGTGVLGQLAWGRVAADKAPEIRVGPIRRVGAEGEKHIEPWIAANPRDASNLVVVGSRYVGDKHYYSGAWFTADGGATWSAGELPRMAAFREKPSMFSDSYATFAPDGTAFCAVLGGPGENKRDLWVYRSEDGGRRWQGPTVLASPFDYPRLVADMDGGKPRLFVAVAYNGDRPIFGAGKRPSYGCAVLRSDDGARTLSVVNFLAMTTLRHQPIDSPLILPDGRLLVGFEDLPTAKDREETREKITHSRTYTASSGDGGKTFSTPAPVGDGPLWDSFLKVAVDRSDGPRRGQVYAVSSGRSWTPPGPRLQTSTDGAVWSKSAPVQTAREGPIADGAVAVSSRGVLGVAWIQGERGDVIRPSDEAWLSREHPWGLYFTASADGGRIFAAPVPVLKTPSRTDTKLTLWPYGTDYISLATPPDGSFHLLWVDTRDGRGLIQTAKIKVRE
jgi:hypothetical protein